MSLSLSPPWSKDTTNWLSPEWRRFIIWVLSELEFRHELLAFDITVRTCHPWLPAGSDQSRYAAVIRCWGGGGVIPTAKENALCSADDQTRLTALIAFRELMRLWPRTSALLPTWVETEAKQADDDDTLENLSVDGMPKEVLEKLEQEVWVCYVQSHFDYRHHYPALPFIRPPQPFDEEL